MRSKCWLLHGRTTAVVVLAAAALSLAGCSAIGPESTWSGSEGLIEGTIVSDSAKELPGIEVLLWGGIDEECNAIEYCATTDLSGRYTVDGVELGSAHAYERTYEIYVNRTPSSAMPMNDGYGTYTGTVTVSANGTWHDVVIVEAEPGPPDDYFE